MGNSKGTKQKPKKPKDVNEKLLTVPIIVAVITTVGTIVVALISSSTALIVNLKPIEITQTAEALHTSVAMTATEDAFQTQTEAVNISMTAFSGTQTTSAIEAEKERLSVSSSQTAEVLVAAQVFMTQTLIAQTIPTPTEIKPVRYEHVVVVGETLKDISERYLILDIYADSIGRANCNPSPAAGDKLIIRYIYVQPGDEGWSSPE